MNATTKEESAGPLGVIGCLMAGFETVGRHLGLIALPVLLDLLLWLGPRLSIASLFQRFVALLVAQPTPDPATARQVAQAAQLLEQFGEQFNLLSLLSALPLLNVPSLLAWRAPTTITPLSEPRVLVITSVLALMAWGVVLVPVGLALGCLYLNSLARQVRAMRSPDEEVEQADDVSGEALSRALGRAMAKLIRVFLFASAVVLVGMVLVLLWTLFVGVALAIAQPLGFLVWSLSIGLGGYLALHLLFVIPSVLLGGRGLLRATWESVVLIHTQFPSVVGLILLVIVIYQGLGFVWSLPSGSSWSLLVGIVGNGCIATGLTAALFVFYQERMVGDSGVLRGG